MTLVARLRSFVRALAGGRRLEREMDEEWRFHLQERTAALMAAGLTSAAAAAQARVEFGDPLRWREQGREARGLGWLHDVRSDVQYALRQMRRTPGFAAVAIATLALGIGANTAIFSLVNGLLLRPLPVVEPHRLATISSAYALNAGFKAGAGWNYSMWDHFRRQVLIFEGAFAWTDARFNLAQGGEMEPANGVFTSGDFFTTLGVTAWLGRTYTAADDVRGGGPDGPVAVISHGLWQARFGGDVDVIGTPLVVDGVRFTIIGVMPPSFTGIEIGRSLDVALPLGTEPLINGVRTLLDNERSLRLTVMVRRKADQPLDAAVAMLRTLQPEVLGLSPEDLSRLPQWLGEPMTLVPAAAGTADRSGVRRQYSRPLLAIFVVVGLVLLIACVNVANLLLTRATARRHELSVRLALGAARWRLARQLLAESLVLACSGALVGLLLAMWSSRALAARLPASDSPVYLDLSLDWRVLVFTAVAALATVVLFGMAPAFRATRVDPIGALKDQDRAVSADTADSVASGLVAAQVALSMVLIVAAGLFVGTFTRLANVPLGFDGDRVLVVEVNTARARLEPATRIDFHHRLVEAVAGVPGVARAAASDVTPLSDASRSPLNVQPDSVLRNAITPGWFAAYGMAIRAGRDFDRHDTAKAAPVLVVNEAYVRRFFPDRAAIGQMVDGRTVVGIASDAVFGSARGGMRPTTYIPLAQSAGPAAPSRVSINISVRPSSESERPVALARSVAAALAAVDRDLDFRFRPLADDVNASLAQERLVATLSGLFGTLALLLAGVGLYGVTSYSVSRRRTEIGIRLALGAAPRGVVRLVLSRVALLVGVGLVAGGAVSIWLSRFIAPLLYGSQPRDPGTFMGAAAILATVGAFAGWLPAYRASRIDPAEALREN